MYIAIKGLIHCWTYGHKGPLNEAHIFVNLSSMTNLIAEGPCGFKLILF